MASCVSRRTKQLLCLPNTDGAAVLRLLGGRHCPHGDAAMLRLLCGKDCRHCSTSTAAKPERKVRTRMKAWQIHKYGGNEEFSLSTSSRIPNIQNPKDILVEIHAASVNPIDVNMREGYGRKLINTMRRGFGTTPSGVEFPLTLGRDFSGVVKETGRGVSRFKPGDEIWGAIAAHRQGTHAQYTVAGESEVSLKPKSLSHIEAASIPYVATTTWSALYITGELKENNTAFKRVLVHGGSGGIGTFAIQSEKRSVSECRVTVPQGGGSQGTTGGGGMCCKACSAVQTETMQCYASTVTKQSEKRSVSECRVTVPQGGGSQGTTGGGGMCCKACSAVQTETMQCYASTVTKQSEKRSVSECRVTVPQGGGSQGTTGGGGMCCKACSAVQTETMQCYASTVTKQLMKAWGADVTTTCSTDAVAMVSSLGADTVIDYRTSDTVKELKKLEKFDLILDPLGGETPSFSIDLLKSWTNAKYITLVMPLLPSTDKYGIPGGLIQSATDLSFNVLKGFSRGRSYRWALFLPNGNALKKIATMVDNKEIKPVIDEVFSLQDVPAAFEKVGQKHGRGKTVIDMKS